MHKLTVHRTSTSASARSGWKCKLKKELYAGLVIAGSRWQAAQDARCTCLRASTISSLHFLTPLSVLPLLPVSARRKMHSTQHSPQIRRHTNLYGNLL